MSDDRRQTMPPPGPRQALVGMEEDHPVVNPWRRPDRPMTLAHRGHCTTIPEQTMAAFEAAILADADAIEADVHRTRDGHLVMLHDDLVDRTTDGHGPVRDMTLDELTRLDAGGWFGPGFRGERVPTLEQLLDLARATGTTLCLEAKGHDRDETLAIALGIGDALARRDEVGRHVLSSFDVPALAAARARYPGLTLAPDRLPERGRIPDANLADQARRLGAPILQVHHLELTAASVAALHHADIAVWAWPTTQPDEIERARRLGVDGLMGDDASELVLAASRGS
jgi:glycerophosphoryl diester phosphodiesterase